MSDLKILELKGKEKLIYDEVNKIYESDKKLTADKILNLAKEKDHPLHDLFEWDDAVAGNKYRLIQARQLISRIIINIQNSKTKEKHKVRAFLSINQSEDGLALHGNQTTDNYYVGLKDVQGDDELVKYQLLKAKSELKAFKVKYSVLNKELSKVFTEIDKL